MLKTVAGKLGLVLLFSCVSQHCHILVIFSFRVLPSGFSASLDGFDYTVFQCVSEKTWRQLAFIPEIRGHWTLPGPRLGMSQLFRCRDVKTQAVSSLELVSSICQTYLTLLLENGFVL